MARTTLIAVNEATHVEGPFGAVTKLGGSPKLRFSPSHAEALIRDAIVQLDCPDSSSLRSLDLRK